jgi:hypothetical protein
MRRSKLSADLTLDKHMLARRSGAKVDASERMVSGECAGLTVRDGAETRGPAPSTVRHARLTDHLPPAWQGAGNTDHGRDDQRGFSTVSDH